MAYVTVRAANEYQYKYRQERRNKWLLENGPCKHCETWEKLEIDHIDPSTKGNFPGWGFWSYKEEVRNKELKKCQVLCEACHAKKTKEERKRPIIHGTYNAYKHRKCHCSLCREAGREYNRGYIKRKQTTVR